MAKKFPFWSLRLSCFAGLGFTSPGFTVPGFFSSALLSSAFLGWSSLPVTAQIIPDNSLGQEGAIATPKGNIRGLPGILIEGGALRGHNLFQSFTEFNVGNGQRVYFANPTGVENILSRVTGSSPSQILGTLGVDGAANLFLLNPRGIVFGPNARLDIAGSFFASTADSLSFENGWQFSATNPNAPPLLLVNLRPGLQRGVPQGTIENAGNLTVGAAQTLSLYGNTVFNRGSLVAPNGTVQVLGDRLALLDGTRINVSGANGAGQVLIGGDFQGKGALPTASQTVVGKDVQILANAIATGNGGRVIVWANDRTRFYGQIQAQGGATSGDGGFAEVSGKKALDFQGSVLLTAPSGVTGTLLLDPTNLTVVDGPNNPPDLPSASNTALLFSDKPGTNSVVNNGTLNNAQANVQLQADQTITFNAPINIAQPGVGLEAEAGKAVIVNSDIFTDGGDVSLFSEGTIAIANAQINTSSKTASNRNSLIFIGATSGIEIKNSTLLSQNLNNTSGTSAPAKGINGIGILSTQGSVLVDNSWISTSNAGAGDAGLVAISARDTVEIRNSKGPQIQAPPGIFSRGNDGQVIIGGSTLLPSFPTPKTIRISNSRLSTDNGAVQTGIAADAGLVIVNAQDLVEIVNGAQLVSLADPDVKGAAGGVGVQAKTIRVFDSSISTSTYAPNSSAGAVLLRASDDIVLSNSNVFNNLENLPTIAASGDGGIVRVRATNLFLENGSQIQTLVRGNIDGNPPASGNAGEIDIQVADQLRLNGFNRNGNPSIISSDVLTGASGNSGNITLSSRLLFLQDRAFVSVSNIGVSGGSGDLKVYSDFIALDRGSFLAAVSLPGQGGNIELVSPYLVALSRGSDITTTSGSEKLLGSGGRISIQAPGGDRTLFVYGFPANDNNILAEAYGGQGGSIQITALSIRNLRFRLGDNPLTNDISTRSAFGLNGNVTVNEIDADPDRGTTPLPDRYVDRRISEGCDPRTRRETSKFIITGPGGLPPNPTEQLTPLTTTAAWVAPETTTEVPTGSGVTRVPDSSAPQPIREAQGFAIAASGEIVLAQRPGVIKPHRVWALREGCYVP